MPLIINKIIIYVVVAWACWKYIKLVDFHTLLGLQLVIRILLCSSLNCFGLLRLEFHILYENLIDWSNYSHTLVRDPVEFIAPCDPSPCGANAVCREQNGAGSCSCIEDHFGDPYMGCRPECIMNSDCPSSKACLRNKCVSPCPGTCATNAECKVLNHIPQCYCIPGYTGDPFTYCSIQIHKRKHLIIFHNFKNKTHLLILNTSFL